jgi:two-component system response regulator AtoC
MENVLTHVVINTQGEVILEEAVGPLLGRKSPTHQPSKEAANRNHNLKDIEKEHIIEVLNQTHWRLGKACELLGISRPTLRHKLKSYEISGNLDTSR